MARPTDVRGVAARLYYLPVATRVPLKFGSETLTHVTCARVCLTVETRDGRRCDGWGETPLSVQWVWPSELPYQDRHERLEQFCQQLVGDWCDYSRMGDVLEVGCGFQKDVLRTRLSVANRDFPLAPMPYLAALVCCSPFDLALHDAFGHVCGCPTYRTYTDAYLNVDLADYLEPARGSSVSFANRYPADYLVHQPPHKLPAWHLVGGLDPVTPAELTGAEPDDGYPVLLADWIRRDGLQCLKIKLRGNDAEWDKRRIVEVGTLALEEQVTWLTFDFNCTVRDPEYVVDILDWLAATSPRMYGMILYVEQPFPYELDEYAIDVHACSARKPLFMDESAHDWQYVRRGRELGWTGVALKTCKTQTGALLSLCWAKSHGMTLMVQDLTNPMLAQITHCQLAQHAGTIMGVETNAMQFYPNASLPEAAVHPGLFVRRNGEVDLSTISGNGFGYQWERIDRVLPEPAASSE